MLSANVAIKPATCLKSNVNLAKVVGQSISLQPLQAKKWIITLVRHHKYSESGRPIYCGITRYNPPLGNHKADDRL